jgi:hypothetical protein
MPNRPSPELDRKEFRWTRIVSPEHLNEFYETILPQIREAARQHGYAIAVHGSMKRDFDLIAAPWSAEHSNVQTLCKAIHRAACGLFQESYQICTDKPCGRLTTMFPVCWIEYPDAPKNGTGHIDLSIMPDAASLAKQPATDEGTETPRADAVRKEVKNVLFGFSYPAAKHLLKRYSQLERELTAATKRADDNKSLILDFADVLQPNGGEHYLDACKRVVAERNDLQLRVKELVAEMGKALISMNAISSGQYIASDALNFRRIFEQCEEVKAQLRTAINTATGKEKE